MDNDEKHCDRPQPQSQHDIPLTLSQKCIAIEQLTHELQDVEAQVDDQQYNLELTLRKKLVTMGKLMAYKESFYNEVIANVKEQLQDLFKERDRLLAEVEIQAQKIDEVLKRN